MVHLVAQADRKGKHYRMSLISNAALQARLHVAVGFTINWGFQNSTK